MTWALRWGDDTDWSQISNTYQRIPVQHNMSSGMISLEVSSVPVLTENHFIRYLLDDTAKSAYQS